MRDPGADAARLTVPRTLFRGTLQRDAGKLRFAPAAAASPSDARIAPAESVITAAVTDAGFDTHGAIYLEAQSGAAASCSSSGSTVRGHDLACPTSALGVAAQGNAPSLAPRSRTAGRYASAAKAASP